MIPSLGEIQRRSFTQRRGYERVLDYFANYFVFLAILFRLTPTQLTFLWVIIQFFAPLFFLVPSYLSFVLGIFLFQAMFIVDLSDGKLFRFSMAGRKYTKPLFPKYLDHLGHYINNAWLFICLGFGTALRFGDPFFFFVGIFASFLYLLNKSIGVNSAWYKSIEERERVTAIFAQAAPRATGSKMRQFIFDFLRIEHLGNALFFGILFDVPQYILVLYATVHFLEFWRKLFTQARLLWHEDGNPS